MQNFAFLNASHCDAVPSDFSIAVTCPIMRCEGTLQRSSLYSANEAVSVTAGKAEARECVMAMSAVVCNGLWLWDTLVAAPAMRATVFKGVWLGAEGAVRSARSGFSSAAGYLKGGY